LINITNYIQTTSKYDWLAFIGGYLACISTVLIAWLSIKNATNIQKQQTKMQLFQKRYDVYEKLYRCMTMIYKSDYNTSDGLNELTQVRELTYFLFDEDIHEYYIEIINNSILLEKEGIYDTKARDWFIEQIEKRKIRHKFDDYLKF